jgi:hypothetical protein
VTITAEIRSRLSLRVSDDVLVFREADRQGVARATVTFTAAARTAGDAEVLLVAQPEGVLAAQGRPVSFSLEGEARSSGALHPHGPTVIGRWRGSGRREGRIVFTISRRDDGALLTIPVRFSLAEP